MEMLDHPSWLWGLSLIVLTMAIHATALKNISVAHGVSSFDGSGGFEHPHDTPPHPFMPSPTFEYSSMPIRRTTVAIADDVGSAVKIELRRWEFVEMMRN